MVSNSFYLSNGIQLNLRRYATAIREISRVLSDECKRRVVVVDTSNEIGGDGDIPHPGIGSARRMQVPKPDVQHEVLIEAVQNHTPEVVIVDEIGTELEAGTSHSHPPRQYNTKNHHLNLTRYHRCFNGASHHQRRLSPCESTTYGTTVRRLFFFF